jgi:hypothetical protein
MTSTVDVYKRQARSYLRRYESVVEQGKRANQELMATQLAYEQARTKLRQSQVGSAAYDAALAESRRIKSIETELIDKIGTLNEEADRLQAAYEQAQSDADRVARGEEANQPAESTAPVVNPAAEPQAQQADRPLTPVVPAPSTVSPTPPADDPIGQVIDQKQKERAAAAAAAAAVATRPDTSTAAGALAAADQRGANPAPVSNADPQSSQTAEQFNAQTNASVISAISKGPQAPVTPGYDVKYDASRGTYDVVDRQTNQPVATGLTQGAAQVNAKILNDQGAAYQSPPALPAATDIKLAPAPVSGPTAGNIIAANQFNQSTNANILAAIQTPTNNRNTSGAAPGDGSVGVEVGAEQARNQPALQAQQRFVNNGDWRFRVSLAAGASYLYKLPQGDRGILDPLFTTDGVIYPYTPQVNTVYSANYTPYDLTHSNYKGYWYKNSNVQEIQITGTFTAQDTDEANYLLAVIHFYRSVTKMFYGQDPLRGSPPPLCYLTGFGEYQFNGHPVVISQFQYSLPNDVDYIRAYSRNVDGTNFILERKVQSVPKNTISNVMNRLRTAGLPKGGYRDVPPAPPTLGLNSPTYVPTKMQMTITCLPIQTRQQVSSQFSVQEFGNGNLQRGGFW